MTRIERPGLTFHLDVIRLSLYDDDGFLGYQIDADGDRVDGAPQLEAQVAPFEAVHPYGFLSRIPAPDVDSGGQVIAGCLGLTGWEGARAYCLALHDSRVVPALARVKDGESVQYGPKNNFIRCHDDGRISTMCTDDGTENGQSIQAEHAPTGWTWSAPWGVQRNDASGFYYRHASGARLELGSIGGIPAPLDAAKSYCKVEAAIVTIRGTAVKLGTGTFDAAAKATQTLAVDSAQQSSIAALQATVLALSGAVSALTAILTNAAAAPAAAAAVAAVATSASAVGASSAALSTATVALPAKSVQVG